MNIFFTNPDPILCAADHNAIHCRKMIIEYAQLLCTAHRILDGVAVLGVSKTGRKQTLYEHANSNLYKATHVNHPSAVWVRTSADHYLWLFRVYQELCAIYTQATGKVHKTSQLIPHLQSPPTNIPNLGWQDPYVAINLDLYPDVKPLVCGANVLGAYRLYIQLKLKEWVERGTKVSWYTQQPDWF